MQDTDAAHGDTEVEKSERAASPPTRLRCRLGFHTAIPSKLWNDGHYFSACERCRTPLIRTPQENWHPVPAHFRIVWRKRTEDDIVWQTHIV